MNAYVIWLYAVPGGSFIATLAWVLWENIKINREVKKQEFKMRLKYGDSTPIL